MGNNLSWKTYTMFWVCITADFDTKNWTNVQVYKLYFSSYAVSLSVLWCSETGRGCLYTFILKAAATNFLILSMFCVFSVAACSTEAGGQDPHLGEGWERIAEFSPIPPPSSPCLQQLSRGLTSEKTHSVSLIQCGFKWQIILSDVVATDNPEFQLHFH